MRCRVMVLCFSFVVACLAISAIAQERATSALPVGTVAARGGTGNMSDVPEAKPPAVPNKEAPASLESVLRVEGEKRFRANCGRCHMAPHKFPPRVMATAIRHMRVRATLTDEDMRYILHYMTQ